jgi:hypothetical protein
MIGNLSGNTGKTLEQWIGINLKGQDPVGKLEAVKPNSMCSHKIKVAHISEIDREVPDWIKKAYDHAN